MDGQHPAVRRLQTVRSQENFLDAENLLTFGKFFHNTINGVCLGIITFDDKGYFLFCVIVYEKILIFIINSTSCKKVVLWLSKHLRNS